MEKSLSEQLADNLAYYVNDTSKRCKNDTSCYYSGVTAKKDSEGCFVGRLLTPEDRIKADKGLTFGASGVNSLCNKAENLGITIPDIIKDNEKIMSNFQKFHDSDEYWTETGLTNEGKTTLKMIINDFELEVKYFEKFLVVTE
jgi:hypothetical protein